MTPASIVKEPASRVASPAFFILALVCFFFGFAGVSCNTDAARQTLNGAASITGAQSQSSELSACLDALKGTNLVTYSGWNFVSGSAPSALATSPGPCRVGQSGLTPGSAASTADATIGVQPLAVTAFAAVALAVLLGLAGLVGLVRRGGRFFALSALGLVAVLTLLLNQARVQTAIVSKLSEQATGNGAPFSVTDFFVVTSGLAYWLALAACAVGTLYSLAAGMFSVMREQDVGPSPLAPAAADASPPET